MNKNKFRFFGAVIIFSLILLSHALLRNHDPVLFQTNATQIEVGISIEADILPPAPPSVANFVSSTNQSSLVLEIEGEPSSTLRLQSSQNNINGTLDANGENSTTVVLTGGVNEFQMYLVDYFGNISPTTIFQITLTNTSSGSGGGGSFASGGSSNDNSIDETPSEPDDSNSISEESIDETPSEPDDSSLISGVSIDETPSGSDDSSLISGGSIDETPSGSDDSNLISGGAFQEEVLLDFVNEVKPIGSSTPEELDAREEAIKITGILGFNELETQTGEVLIHGEAKANEHVLIYATNKTANVQSYLTNLLSATTPNEENSYLLAEYFAKESGPFSVMIQIPYEGLFSIEIEIQNAEGATLQRVVQGLINYDSSLKETLLSITQITRNLTTESLLLKGMSNPSAKIIGIQKVGDLTQVKEALAEESGDFSILFEKVPTTSEVSFLIQAIDLENKVSSHILVIPIGSIDSTKNTAPHLMIIIGFILLIYILLHRKIQEKS